MKFSWILSGLLAIGKKFDNNANKFKIFYLYIFILFKVAFFYASYLEH
jgi:hypothetical protein